MTSVKISDIFTNCHIQKSTDYVPFVCFWGTPLECGRHIWKPPLLTRPAAEHASLLPRPVNRCSGEKLEKRFSKRHGGIGERRISEICDLLTRFRVGYFVCSVVYKSYRTHGIVKNKIESFSSRFFIFYDSRGLFHKTGLRFRPN